VANSEDQHHNVDRNPVGSSYSLEIRILGIQASIDSSLVLLAPLPHMCCADFMVEYAVPSGLAILRYPVRNHPIMVELGGGKGAWATTAKTDVGAPRNCLVYAVLRHSRSGPQGPY